MDFLPEKINRVYNKKSLLSMAQIKERILIMSDLISKEFEDENPIFLSTLNGAFMFSSDIMKALHFPCQIEFIKLQSYKGTTSTGVVKKSFGLDTEVKDRTIIILEDIVDTGTTINHLLKDLNTKQAARIEIITLLFKRDAYQYKHPIWLSGFDIADEFVIGYGMDLDGYGRNLDRIDILVPKE